MKLASTLAKAFATASIATIISASSSAAIDQNKNFEVRLNSSFLNDKSSSKSLDQISNKIIEKNGFQDWTFSAQDKSGEIISAYGSPVQIQNFSHIDAANIEAAVNQFLGDYKEIFADSQDELKITQKSLVNGKWYVTIRQYIDGVEILFSDLSLRISPEGKVFYLRSSLKRNAKNLLANSNVNSDKSESLLAAATDNIAKDAIAKEENMYVLPKINNDKMSLYYAKKFTVSSESLGDKFSTFVNISDGTILWRTSQLNKAITVKTSGAIIPENPKTPTVSKGLSHMYVTVADKQYTTDADGNLSLNVTDSAQYSAKLEGPWAKLSVSGLTSSIASGYIKSDGSSAITFNDNNSNVYARTMFYHTNFVHDYICKLDTNFKGVNKQISVIMNAKAGTAGINAYSDDNGDITFDGVTATNYHLGESPTVLYHEYGHSINTTLYKQLGASQGMESSTSQEAFADLNAALMTDNPKIGEYAMPEAIYGKYLRTLKNNWIFPDSVKNEGHNDELILSGAYWDLRESTNLTFARNLTHFIKYSLIDGDDATELPQIYSKWFIETLVHTDDDNNLKTPGKYDKEIITAFNNHKIGIGLYSALNFAHKNIDNTKDTINSYPAKFSVLNDGYFSTMLSNYQLHYRVNGGEYKTIDATPLTEKANYQAIIPVQKPGTIVEYYFTAKSSFDNDVYSYYSNVSDRIPFRFYVGYEVESTESFQNQQLWTATDDLGANSTVWEWGVPISYKIANTVVQPQGGFDGANDKCWATGLAAKAGLNYFSSSVTSDISLESQTLNFSRLNSPVVAFRYYISKVELMPQMPSESKVYISLSQDAGKNWSIVDSITEAGANWEKYILPIGFYAKKFDNIKIKITAVNISPFAGSAYDQPITVYEAFIDNFEIWKPINATTADVAAEQNFEFELYPNPSSDYAIIKTNSSYNERASIEIFDALGSRVFFDAGSQIGNSLKIPLSNFNSGTYFVKVNLNGKTLTKALNVIK
jgi:hypothetical protein